MEMKFKLLYRNCQIYKRNLKTVSKSEAVSSLIERMFCIHLNVIVPYEYEGTF